MNTENETTRPFTIVVGIDYSDLGDQAFEHALATAELQESAHIHVVHVLGASASNAGLGGVKDADLSEESERLKAHVERMLVRYGASRPDEGKAPFARLTTHVGLYRAAESIGQLAADVEADLVVVGTHGRRGVPRFLLGSVAETTVRLAPCPVLVVRPPGAAPRIEPACPLCLETRRETDGGTFWCEQHRASQERRHTYHFDSNRPSHQSGLLIPF